MLNLVGRNLRISVFKTTSVHRLFPRSSSSSPTASDNSFAVSYLINSCGFPPDKAISASKRLNIKTPDRADSVIAFLKNQGFTETQITQLVRRFPVALKCNPTKTLLPKFEFLSSIGLSGCDIAKILTTYPIFLGRSLKNHIEPTFNLLTDLLQSDDRTLTAIKRCPWLLHWDLHVNMVPNIHLLQDIGVPRSYMLYVLTHAPKIFIYSTQRFKKCVEEVVEMGFDSVKLNFMLAVHVIGSNSKSSWEKKMESYEKWGWSKSQILQAFRTSPWCMMNSEEKIDKVMDYLVNKMRYETSIIAKSPKLISLSMEKRIIPRCLVYQYCLENGLMKDKNYCGLSSWLLHSENRFIKRLERYEKEAPGVQKFYQEKLDHPN